MIKKEELKMSIIKTWKTDGCDITLSEGTVTDKLLSGSIRVDCFLYPEAAVTFGELPESDAEFVLKICKNHGFKVTDKSRFVKVSAIASYKGVGMMFENGFYSSNPNMSSSWMKINYLPADLFYGKVEKDVVDMTVIDYLLTDELREAKKTCELDLVIKLQLKQKSNRFRNFGKFENVLSDVIKLSELKQYLDYGKEGK
jgi:hypothetical protein